MNKKIIKSGSVRIDLLGGTLDLYPINLVLPNVITLNLATSLKTYLTLEMADFDGIEINSMDYNSSKRYSKKDFSSTNLENDFFGKFKFIISVLNLFQFEKGLTITVKSDSPPGAGLGGSSAMGITCYKACCEFLDLEFNREEAIKKVNAIEAKILNCGPAGYQDYYPALFGGILALKSLPGEIQVEQLFDSQTKLFIEEHLTLVYSNETRFSAINNWEVYKAFFDKDKKVYQGLSQIAQYSHLAYKALKGRDFQNFLSLIAKEGEERERLFPNIISKKTYNLYQGLKKSIPQLGIKVCGAGGGGCFLLIHNPNEKTVIENAIKESQMKILDFKIESPVID